MKKYSSCCVLPLKTVALILCCCVSFFSCLKNKDSTGNGPKAQMAITNYVVNGAVFDIYFDDAKITTTPLSFGSSISPASSPYLSLGAGIHNFKIISGTNVVTDNTISLEPGKNYSLFLYDTLKGNIVKSWLVADKIEPVDSIAKARFLQFIPGTDSLTIYLLKDTLGFAVREAYLGNKADPGTDSDFFVKLTPGNYLVQLQRNNTIIFPQSPVVLLPGKLYSFIARGVANGTGEYKETLTIVQHN